MSIEYVELTIKDAEPINIEIAAVGDQGAPGPAGAAGLNIVGPTTASGFADGYFVSRNGVVDLATDAEIVTEAELTAALAAYLPIAGGVLTGLLSFSGTTHAGIRLNNLTTAQRNAIGSPAAGSMIWNSTDSRVNIHDGTAWTNGFARIDGDTFTGSVFAPSLETRNGTAATSLLVNNRWTSATNRETGFVRWTSDVLQIGTEKGSLGGSARGLDIQTDGITRIAFGASAGITTNETVAINAANISGTGGVNFMSVTPSVTGANSSNRPWLAYTANSTTLFFRDMVNSRMHFQLAPGSSSTAATTNFFCRVDVDSQLRWRPATLETLSVNGMIAVELTSNTTGNLVYRGSDGMTRRMALTFV